MWYAIAGGGLILLLLIRLLRLKKKGLSRPKKGSHSKTIEKLYDKNGNPIGTVFNYPDGTGAVGKHRKTK